MHSVSVGSEDVLLWQTVKAPELLNTAVKIGDPGEHGVGDNPGPLNPAFGHGAKTRTKLFRRSIGPDGGPNVEPDGPRSPPDVGFSTSGVSPRRSHR